MLSPVNVGNEVLLVSDNNVSSNDTADFIATIRRRIGDTGKLQFASLSDVKKGECMLHLVYRGLYNVKKYMYIISEILYKNETLSVTTKRANLYIYV